MNASWTCRSGAAVSSGRLPGGDPTDHDGDARLVQCVALPDQMLTGLDRGLEYGYVAGPGDQAERLPTLPHALMRSIAGRGLAGESPRIVDSGRPFVFPSNAGGGTAGSRTVTGEDP